MNGSTCVDKYFLSNRENVGHNNVGYDAVKDK